MTSGKEDRRYDIQKSGGFRWDCDRGCAVLVTRACATSCSQVRLRLGNGKIDAEVLAKADGLV